MIDTKDIPKLTHDEAMRLARTDCERLIAELEALRPDDWAKPTDCGRWDVKDIVAHLIGMSTDLLTMREMMRQQKTGKAVAKAEGLSDFDGWTEWQVQRFRELDPAQTLDTYRAAAPKFLHRRDTAPRPLRLMRFPSPPYGWWSFAYLMDDILTRDTWMHRVDIARATGRPMTLDAAHDGRFVANVIADLAARWDRPFTIELTGPAGGSYVHAGGADPVRLDAVECCRILSGRTPVDGDHGLPGDVVPF